MWSTKLAETVPASFSAQMTSEDQMKSDLERNLGEQPIKALLQAHELNAHALVAASTEHITHKMVSRACRGRRLTPNVQGKILRALNAASGKSYSSADLFSY